MALFGLPRIDVILSLSEQTPQDSCPLLRYTTTTPPKAYCGGIKTAAEITNGVNRTNFLDENTVVRKCSYDYQLFSCFQKAEKPKIICI